MAADRPPRKTAARGYDHEHQKRRRALLAQLVDGTPCRRCGLPMFRWQKLDLGHPLNAPASTGSRADALEHARCNRGHRIPGVRTPRPNPRRPRW